MSTFNALHDKLSILKWDTIFWVKYLFQSDFKKAIKHNKSLKNIHKGERCFIVGNGPSLKNMNLEGLENEYVITVNTIFRNDSIFSKIKSNCHVISDPNLFKLNKTETDNFSKNTKKYNSNILLITPYYKNNIFKQLFKDKIYQIFPHRLWSKNLILDFTHNMPVSQNVVHTAIYTAVYMGFKDIILIGCEMTSFYENFAANVGKHESFHAYELTDEDKKGYEKVKDSHDNAYMLHDYAITFDIFKDINRYCESNHIRIINATIGGILDMFPRLSFDKILMK